MEIWLKQKKKKLKLRLPVIPPEYELISESNNTQVTIDSLGEINLIGTRKLKKISLASFFPKQKYSFCEYTTFPAPKECVKIIEKMKKNGKLRLTMTGTPINMECTIESFIYGENDASKDINFTIEFLEYRKLKSSSNRNKLQVKKMVQQVSTLRESKSIESLMYIVKPGDNLCKISKKLTGTTANWKAIYLQNKDIIGANPRKINIGESLVIKYEGNMET